MRGAATLLGNYIGTNAAGDRALGNDGDGVLVESGQAIVGRAFSPARPNVISGNGGSGIRVAAAGATLQVTGNYVGLNAAGNAALGNRGDGVRSEAAKPVIGGNVIGGNGGNGVLLTTGLADIRGNFIGTNAAGNAAVGNALDGVAVVGASSATVGKGGRTPSPVTLSPQSSGNVISGNGRHGVSIGDGANRNAGYIFVSGNLVGTDATGTAALGNAGSGVYVAAHAATVSGNLVAANRGDGVTLAAAAPRQSLEPSAFVSYNRIGAGFSKTGATPPALGNGGNGVAVQNGAAATADSNVIAFNAGAGVLVTSPPVALAPFGTGITRNSIYSNGGLGIDLAATAGGGADGVTPNDPGDADEGPNHLLNFPAVTYATSGVNGSRIGYSFDGEPGQEYELQFFSSAAPDPSGNGEGETYLTFTGIHTDANGHAEGKVDTLLPTAGRYVTGTASLRVRDDSILYTVATSEFSTPVLAVQGPTPATVVGRHVFYNNSFFDGFADGAADDAAVAPDTQALLPGQTASAANLTGYTKGLNGLMVDVLGLPADADLSWQDFEFRAWEGASGEVKEVYGVIPSGVTLRRGAGDGGSDRVTLYFPDYPSSDRVIPFGLANLWLQVTMKANPDTGLARPDVFAFGNLIAETGDAATPRRVGAIDLATTRSHLSSAPAPIDSRYDHNRDGRVNALDLAAVRANYGRALFDFSPWMPAASTQTAPQALVTVRQQVLGQ